MTMKATGCCGSYGGPAGRRLEMVIAPAWQAASAVSGGVLPAPGQP
ncbi:hypothetical protein OG884_25300 [Streptosporangium sp. NBC_01755]|nr:hypothetical protein [Streptosporangium sp. NBC_01755]WSC98186.1 hypothetical protein OG884_25300 [Streptosporangium sp. NBC_01755]